MEGKMYLLPVMGAFCVLEGLIVKLQLFWSEKEWHFFVL